MILMDDLPGSDMHCSFMAQWSSELHPSTNQLNITSSAEAFIMDRMSSGKIQAKQSGKSLLTLAYRASKSVVTLTHK